MIGIAACCQDRSRSRFQQGTGDCGHFGRRFSRRQNGLRGPLTSVTVGIDPGESQCFKSLIHSATTVADHWTDSVGLSSLHELGH